MHDPLSQGGTVEQHQLVAQIWSSDQVHTPALHEENDVFILLTYLLRPSARSLVREQAKSGSRCLYQTAGVVRRLKLSGSPPQRRASKGYRIDSLRTQSCQDVLQRTKHGDAMKRPVSNHSMTMLRDARRCNASVVDQQSSKSMNLPANVGDCLRPSLPR